MTLERIRPADAEACAAELARLSRERRAVRVRGGGTKDHLGDLAPVDTVLETLALSGIVDHVAADLTITARAGTRFAEVQRALADHGQFLPLDPPHASGATLGGIVAANSAGFWRARHGGPRDLLIGTTTALADGTLARSGGRVVKNVAGYDLNKLLVGSLGTLGVIVETTFKVLPVPPARGALRATLRRGADAFALTDALARTSLRPSALVVERSGGAWHAVVAAHGPAPLVSRTLAEAAALARKAGPSTEGADDPEDLLRPARALAEEVADGAVVRAALPLSAQRAFAETASGIEGFARLVADAGSGIVRAHLRGEDAVVIAGADTLLAAAAVLGGSARVERRDAALAASLGAWGATKPSGHFLMARIKEAFDPHGVLEPGRSVVA